MSDKGEYEFKQEMDGIFDEAYFAFMERYKKDPTAASTYIRYLRDVLFLDTDQHLALFTTYDKTPKDFDGHWASVSQDSPPVTKGSKGHF